MVKIVCYSIGEICYYLFFEGSFFNFVKVELRFLFWIWLSLVLGWVFFFDVRGVVWYCEGVRSEIDWFFGVAGLSKEFVFVCGGLE